MGETAKPKDPGTKKCDDGYYAVWKWCFKQTTLDKLKKPLSDVVDWPEIEWPAGGAAAMCKMLYNVYMAAYKSLKQALALPIKYLNMAKQLVEYPFNLASSLVSSALGFLDRLNSLIDELLSGGEIINDLKKLCNSILSCPYAADTALGKLAANILDALKAGNSITEYLKELKNTLSGMANDAINQVKEVPLNALNNVQNAYYNLLKQLGIESLIQHADNIAACIKSLCTISELGEKYYAAFNSMTSDGVVNTVKKTINEGAGKFTAAITDTASEVGGKLDAAKNDLTQLLGYPNW